MRQAAHWFIQSMSWDVAMMMIRQVAAVCLLHPVLRLQAAANRLQVLRPVVQADYKP